MKARIAPASALWSRMVRATHCPEDANAEAERQTSSLAGLALVVGLVVAGLYLIEALRAGAALAGLAG